MTANDIRRPHMLFPNISSDYTLCQPGHRMIKLSSLLREGRTSRTATAFPDSASSKSCLPLPLMQPCTNALGATPITGTLLNFSLTFAPDRARGWGKYSHIEEEKFRPSFITSIIAHLHEWFREPFVAYVRTCFDLYSPCVR